MTRHFVAVELIKKFIGEKQYPPDVRAFLFRDRDGRTLPVLWKARGRQDVSVPLPGVKDVRVIRIDGIRRNLDADGAGVTLSITEDPLLLYDGGPGTLPGSRPTWDENCPGAVPESSIPTPWARQVAS